MIHQLKYVVVAFIFITSHSQSQGIENVIVTTQGSPLPCPDPDEIQPCICNIGSDFEMEMDCSQVIDDQQLKNVFNRALPFPDFKTLTMESNPVFTLLSDCFGDATFQQIHITEGNLTEVQPGALLKSATTLKELIISTTELSIFPFNELEQFEVLTDIDLSANLIDEFPIIESASIAKLILDNNYITVIPENAFDALSSIRFFTCSGCGTEAILIGLFAETKELDYIDLGVNDLSYLPKDSFELHGEASTLILSNNNLSIVDVNAIRGVTFKLDLNHNQLMYLYEEVWGPVMESLVSFSAADNPLLCGCDIAWIILNNNFMDKISGSEMCSNGQLVKDLDPQIYKDMCFTSTNAHHTLVTEQTLLF